MKNNYTHISIVLDRSGSMDVIRQDTIGGFNKFLKDQQGAPGEATISLIQFDHVYESLYSGIPIETAKPLDEGTFVPRGWTALLDALGQMIDETGEFLDKLDESQKPEKVVFVVITDGEENHSRKFNLDQIHEKITLQRETYKWEFVFLGANQDAIKSGRAMGMQAQDAMNYVPTSGSVARVYAAASDNLRKVRSHMVDNMSFTPEQRKVEEEEVRNYNSKLKNK